MIVIGIDPGNASGGAAKIGIKIEDGIINTGIISTIAFKNISELELYQWFSNNLDNNVKAGIEFVRGMPDQALKASFSFFRNVGLIEGFLISSYIPYIEITPRSWQKHFNVKRGQGESKSEWKKRLRQIAQRLYPTWNITNETSDAILIAEYLKDQYLYESNDKKVRKEE